MRRFDGFAVEYGRWAATVLAVAALTAGVASFCLPVLALFWGWGQYSLQTCTTDYKPPTDAELRCVFERADPEFEWRVHAGGIQGRYAYFAPFLPFHERADYTDGKMGVFACGSHRAVHSCSVDATFTVLLYIIFWLLSCILVMKSLDYLVELDKRSRR